MKKKPRAVRPQSDVEAETTAGGALFVVATPIGNLADLSARAADTFREVDFVVAEDTRRTRVLLGHVGIGDKEIVHVDMHASEELLARVSDRVAAGATAAVVSDAGTPVVADPGAALVRACRARGARIVVIPGPSAVTAALSVCGFTVGAFRTFGFLPRGASDRERLLSELTRAREAVVFFEAPHRMGAALEALAARMPDRQAFVGRELTKVHEEQLVGRLADLARDHAAREWLGELTIVLGPQEIASDVVDPEHVRARIREELARGKPAKLVAEVLALETGLPKRELYEQVNRIKAESA